LIDYAAVESGVLSALATLGVNTLEIYSGQLEDEFETISARFPAVYVVCSDASFEPQNRADKVKMGIDIFCCARDIGLAGEARIAAQGIASNVRTLLHRKRIGIDGVLTVTSERLMFWHPKSRIAVMHSKYEFITVNL